MINTNMKKLLILGDSHIRVFNHEIIKEALKEYEFSYCGVPGSTTTGLHKDMSQTRAKLRFNACIDETEAEYFVMMMGEVDNCSAIWFKAKNDNITIDEALNHASTNYKNFLLSVKSRNKFKKMICISTPLPTIKDNVKELPGLTRHSVDTDQKQKTDLALKYNAIMKDFCESNNIHYVDLDPYSLGDDGTVKIEFINRRVGDPHYQIEIFAQLLADNKKCMHL